MTDTDMFYMASLEKRNAELEAKVAELEEKHWNECGQIAHYLVNHIIVEKEKSSVLRQKWYMIAQQKLPRYLIALVRKFVMRQKTAI